MPQPSSPAFAASITKCAWFENYSEASKIRNDTAAISLSIFRGYRGRSDEDRAIAASLPPPLRAARPRRGVMLACSGGRMKLYDSKMAPNPRRVRIFLAEKGIEVPTVQVDIGPARENRKPPYIDKNPLGGTPMLELDDGTCIAESVAICRYFEETHPEPPLMGVGPKDRALVEMWQRRVELELFRAVTTAFQNTHDFFKGRIEQVPAYGEVARKTGRARLAWLDAELASRPFVAGDRYTIADITLLVAIDFGRVVDMRIDPAQKNLQRWHESVSARPSAKA
jgi:glutathione S-transferase